MRALFVNEGALGPGVLGHGSLDAAMREAIVGNEDFDAQFAALPALEGRRLRLADEVRGLRKIDLDLQVSRWHAMQGLAARRIVRAALAQGPIDVMHVHSHAIALGLTDIMRTVPTFVSVDATIWDWRSQAIWRPLRPTSRAALAGSLALESKVFGRAVGVLAWSKWARRGVLASCPEAKVVDHRPGVDLTRFRPRERTRRDGPLRVIFVGGRFAEKGGEDLLWALEPRLGRDVELDLVTPAEVPERPGVHLHRLAPGDPALAELHRQADVFCLPTYGDASPFVVLEAHASAVPVISTDVGSISEMLDDGRAGVILRPGDREGLRRALDDLLQDEDRRRALGAAGRAHCEARFDGARQHEELVALLEAAATVRR